MRAGIRSSENQDPPGADTEQVLRLSDLWWAECVNWSHQDQISLPVLLWMAQTGVGGVPPVRWNVNIPWNEWWQLYEHGGVQ